MVRRGTITLDKELLDTVGLRECTAPFRKRIEFAKPFDTVPEVDVWLNGIEGIGPPNGLVFGALAVDERGFTLEVRTGSGYGITALLLVYRAEAVADEMNFRLMTSDEFHLAMAPSEGAA